jgi:hypothetical protein
MSADQPDPDPSVIEPALLAELRAQWIPTLADVQAVADGTPVHRRLTDRLPSWDDVVVVPRRQQPRH